MAEIIYRFPSKVPYGYVEVKFESAETNPDSLAKLYVEDFKRFREAEEKALQAPSTTQVKHQVKPVTEILEPSGETDHDGVVDLVVKELGGVPVPDDDADAPWNNKPEPVKKEYAVAEGDWDFS